MNRSYRFELVKLRHPGTLVACGLLTVSGVLETIIAFVNPASGTALSKFASTAGATRGFATAGTFMGLLVFVLVVVSITSEYGQGTLRTLLIHQPRRALILSGKLAALMTVVAAALLAALAFSIVAAFVAAQVRGVNTDAWWTLGGLVKTGGAYLNALLSAALFSVAAAALAVVLRSNGLTLAVGVVWLGPVEQLLKQSWTPANRVLPGLIFDAVSRGGLPDAPYLSALLKAAAYAVVAITVALVSFQRRDVTA